MKTLLALLLVLGVSACSKTKTPASVAASAKSSRPVEFLSARVGDSLDAPHKMCRSGGYALPCCGSPSGLVTICSVEPLPKIGDVRVKDADKMYLDGRLISWGFSFDFDDYDVMKSALATRYGPADSSYAGVTPSLDRTGDVRYEGKEWHFADGTVSLWRAAGASHGTAKVEAQSNVGITEFRRRDASKKAQKKADQAAAAARDLGVK
jgi:hypothetical protein